MSLDASSPAAPGPMDRLDRLDLLITGATVVHTRPQLEVIENAVIGIAGPRIAFVARAADAPRVDARRAIDLRGHLVLPGFVNVHTHTILTMVRGVAEDMGFAPAYTPGVPHGHEVTPDEAVALARLGARMSGLDFSSASLAEARTLAQRCNTPIDYHESDVFAATDVLPRGEFDLVYTGIGALCWLPSIERWAQTVGALLKPGGRLFIREGHPMLWALDEEQRDSLQVAFPYFERSEPLVWDEDTTYVETESSLKATVTHEWNHGLGEIISALLAQGLEITGLVEHQSIPWEALPGQMVVDERGEWRLKEAPWRLPLSYTLQAVKRMA